MQHGLYGDGVRNKESEKILESLCTMNLTVAKTIFNKRAIHLVTYESGLSKTLVDCCLVRRNQRTFLEEPFVCDFNIMKSKDTWEKFVPRRKVWKLHKDYIKSDFSSFSSKYRQGI